MLVIFLKSWRGCSPLIYVWRSRGMLFHVFWLFCCVKVMYVHLKCHPKLKKKKEVYAYFSISMQKELVLFSSLKLSRETFFFLHLLSRHSEWEAGFNVCPWELEHTHYPLQACIKQKLLHCKEQVICLWFSRFGFVHYISRTTVLWTKTSTTLAL